MKKKRFVIALTVFLLSCVSGSALAFDSGSTGADGAFTPTASIEITLPADGKLNYSTVNVPAGVTVTFKKNTANTPVYMLATGNVTIAGTMDLSATDATVVAPGRGGPGGLDGGLGAYPDTCGGAGLGLGGGKAATKGTGTMSYGGGGGGASFGTAGTNGATPGASYSNGGITGETYGNISILPLIGGSGGGGGCGGTIYGGTSAGGGGGGGGAILIASSGTIDVSGTIRADGGNGGAAGTSSGKGGGGSGGSIKLMADVIKGNGTLSAVGGIGTVSGGSYNGGSGGNGRIRLESNTLLRTAATSPSYTYNNAPLHVFPPNTPALNIVSVGGTAVPASPTGKFSTPDIILPNNLSNPVNVGIQATNIPAGTTVTVNVVSQVGNPSSATAVLAGTDASSSATASVNLSQTHVNVITATATFTIQTASNWTPLASDSERIVKVRVDSIMGGGSSVTYITESGKEILAGG